MFRLILSALIGLLLAGACNAQAFRGAPKPFRSGISTALSPVASSGCPSDLSSYDTDAAAWFTAICTAGGAGADLSSADKTAFNTYIAGLKTDGIWSLLDRLAFLAAPNSTAAYRDIKNPAKVWTPNCNSGTCLVSYQGFTGDATSAAVNATDTMGSSGNWQQDSASFGCWVNTTSATSGRFTDCGLWETGSSQLRPSSSTGTNNQFQINGATQLTTTGGTSRTGFWVASRTSANDVAFYKNGSSVASSAANASNGAYTTNHMSILRNSGTYVADRVMMVFYGGGLTSTQVSNLYTRTQTLAVALSVPQS